MFKPVISATGLFTPADSISNEELVASFNTYVANHNAANADAIAAGDVTALEPSSVEFIEKASGIKSRYVLAKAPILDPEIMEPQWAERPNEDISVPAEIGVAAAKNALARAGRDAKDVDAVLCACSNLQRAYPAIAIEIQDALGIDGFGFDMRRLWLHQANTNMNRMIAERVLGHEANEDESPTVLDTYANTSSAGSVIAFHLHNEDQKASDTGLLCAFGAGYSAGTVFVRKAA